MIDCSLFRRQLRLNRIAREGQSLLLDIIALLTFLLFDLRSFIDEVGDEAVLGQLIVGLPLHFRLLVGGMRHGSFGFLIEQFALQSRFLRRKLRLRGFRLRLRFVRTLFQFRTGQL